MKSIKSKILLYTGLTFLLVLGLVIGVFSTSLYRSVRRDSRQMISHTVNEIALQIEKSNLEAITAARTMALSQETGLFGEREKSSAFARSVLEHYPQFTGAYFGYEPNADGNDRRYAAQGGSLFPGHDASGRFLPYWFREEESIQINPLVDMETSLYYQGVKEQFLSRPEQPYLVTEPYMYEGKMIVEQAHAVVINGNFKGIAGVDRSLVYIHGFLKDLRPYETSDFILISHLGGVIASTQDASMETQKISETPFADVLGYFYERREPLLTTYRDPQVDEDYIYASAPIETGSWTLVMRVAEDEILIPAQATLWQVLLISGLGLLGTFLVLVWIANSITRPVRRAVESADRIAAGDLTTHVESSAKDETGRLLNAIQTMNSNLNSLIGQVRKSVAQVTTSAAQLAASSRQVRATIVEQVSSTQQVVSSATEISANSKELLRTIQEVAEVSESTAQSAGAGQSSLQGMQQAIHQMEGASVAVAERLRSIQEKAEGITGVVTTITKVADQTNLLSLNAAIEAEKAGQYGQGFSVVAQEIRRLADQTAVATLDIEKIVQGMLTAVFQGVAEIDSFRGEVKHAVQEVERAGAELNRTIEQVRALSPRFEDVNRGMSSQTEAAEQIRQSMLQLSEVSRQTEIALREAHVSIEQLGEVAEGLESEVGRFHLKS